MFNQITYNQPKTPAIFSALTLGNDATVETAYGPLSFVSYFDLVVKNGDAGKHPFHLHGHKPMLVNRAENYTSTDVTLNPPVPNNLTNPMRRDTFHIPSGASATLRFVSDNPGVWFFHCHIEWHLEAGLALQIVEAPLEAQKYVNNVSQAMRDNCQSPWKTKLK
ncbi:hypothetical protein MPER_08757 [Moniliophthora perniciosa FA553]|nr:hypothetical protein MPER_08757 [Moniliophthora perniciosa FA553]